MDSLSWVTQVSFSLRCISLRAKPTPTNGVPKHPKGLRLLTGQGKIRFMESKRVHVPLNRSSKSKKVKARLSVRRESKLAMQNSSPFLTPSPKIQKCGTTGRQTAPTSSTTALESIQELETIFGLSIRRRGRS